MTRLEDKVAIVTGASRGTGQAIARRLIADGAKVLLADLLDDPGKSLAAELGSAARYLHLDISEEEGWAEAIRFSEVELGPLTTLVNNAAILHIAPIEFTSVDDYMRVVRVNELGTFLGVRSAIEPMRKNGGGSIINIASIDGHHAAPGTAAYSASKFGVRGITKVAALELGRYGIRINSINPAAGSDEMLQPFFPELDVTAMRDAQEKHDPPPIGRRGRVQDVAASVAFLASDDSEFYTGADFDLDGGITAGMNIRGGIPGAPRNG